MARATHVIAIAAAVSFAAAVRAESASVKPGALVEVSFSAAVEKGPNVEDDPSLAELLPISAGRQSKTGAKFTAARWDFLSADGKAMPHPRSPRSPRARKREKTLFAPTSAIFPAACPVSRAACPAWRGACPA